MRNIHPFATLGIVLLVIGGLNWGLVGLFNFDLVGYLFGPSSVLSRIVYVLVGLSAIGVGLWLPATSCGCSYLSTRTPTSAG
jgi:uncharacterized protein